MNKKKFYRRKGGHGRKGSLRTQFNYYVKRLQNKLYQESAFEFARTGTLPEGDKKVMFIKENLDYDKVFLEGITRKEGNITKRYFGEVAIQIQIKSLKLRASKTYQNDLYISNYLKAMKDVGYTHKEIKLVEEKMKKTSIDKMTYLINTGRLPSINYQYSRKDERKKISRNQASENTQKILDSLDKGVTTDEIKSLRSIAKQAKPLIEKLVTIKTYDHDYKF